MDPVYPLLAALVPEVTKYLATILIDLYKKSQEEKVNYTNKLMEAEGDDIFKYLLLINVATLEGYTAQTRLQAQQSFIVSVVMAIAGFLLLAFGIVLGIVSQFFPGQGLEIAYLTAIAGVLTQFISGVFFYIYNRTLQQINLFHTELQGAQKVSTSLLLSSLVSDVSLQDATKAELAKLLLSESPQNNLDQQGRQTKTKDTRGQRTD